MIKAPRLKAGDTIALVAPASGVVRPERVEASVRYLEGCGYRVRPGRHLVAVHGAFGGTDLQRAEDLNSAIRDTGVQAIFALRGGYGSPRILPLIDYGALRRSPKIFVGFSDITALQLAIFRRCGLITFSGPLPGPDFSDPVVDSFTEEIFWRLVTSRSLPGRLANPVADPCIPIFEGSVSGPILGGCLTMIIQVLGTRFCPKFKESILILEDVHEEPYRVDRMMTHLGNSGILKAAAGFVFGKWPGCVPQDPKALHFPVEQIIRETVAGMSKPTLANFAYGHVPQKITLPIGLPATLDATKGELRPLESAVA